MALLNLKDIPEELANRMMMRHGSGQLLRALRGEPEPRPEPAPVLKFRAPRIRPHKPVTTAPMPIAIKRIAMDVAEAFGLTVDELTSSRRETHFAHARSVFYRLVRDRTNSAGYPTYSFSRIASFVGRDHSTVIHAIQMFDVYCRQDPEIAAVYERLTASGQVAA